MKRVLVTGANGFIGKHAAAFLEAAGYEVHAVSTAASLSQPETATFKWHQADLLDPAKVSALLWAVKPSHLLHLAWYAIPGKFWSAPENLQWVNASISLMRAFHQEGGQRVVMAGTCAEYDWSYAQCSEASTPCQPATLYGTAKHATRLLLEGWSRQTGMSSAWGRIFFLYGPGEYPARLVPLVIGSILDGKPARCTHGEQIRDFMYVEDVAAAFVALLDSEVEGNVNIASGHPAPLKEIVCAIADQLGRRDLVELGAIPANSGDPAVLIADVSRLRDEVGFVPKYSLQKGIERTIESFKARQKKNDKT